MAGYLLLRDNKEMGPLTLESLLQLGLKPYDLVWVEQKSAAWRYPSEIPELKAHAPVVEEQPFDRFYRKPAPEEFNQPLHRVVTPEPVAVSPEPVPTLPAAIPVATPVAVPVQAQTTPALPPRKAEEAAAPIEQRPSRKVYVHMPAGKQPVAPTTGLEPSSRQSQPQQEPTQPQPERIQPQPERIQPQAESIQPQPERIQPQPPHNQPQPTVAQPLPAVKAPEWDVSLNKYAGLSPEAATPVTVNERSTRFSQPMEELRDQYRQTPDQRKAKAARRMQVQGLGKKAAAAALILALGLAAAYAFFPSLTDKQVAAVQPEPVTEMAQTPGEQPARGTEVNGAVDASTVAALANSTAAETTGASGSSNASPNELLETSPTDSRTHSPTESDDAADNHRQPIAGKDRMESDVKGVDQRVVSESEADPSSRSTDAAQAATKRQKETVQQSSGVAIDPVTGERRKRSRGEAAGVPSSGAVNMEQDQIGRRAVPSTEWDGKVSVMANDYKKVALGGIRNLQLSVTNKGGKALSNVTVELRYLKPSGETLRTEHISFHDVEAGSSATLRIPDTNRGARVTYKIVQVSSGIPVSVAGN